MDLHVPLVVPYATGAPATVSDAAAAAKEQLLKAQNAQLQQLLSSQQAALAAERETQRQLEQQQAALAQQRLTWQAHHAEMVPQPGMAAQPAVANTGQPHHPHGRVASLCPQMPGHAGAAAYPPMNAAGGALGGAPQQMFMPQQRAAPGQMPTGGVKTQAKTEGAAGPVSDDRVGGQPTAVAGAAAARPPAFLPSAPAGAGAERLAPVPKTSSGKRDAMSLATGAGWVGKPAGNGAAGEAMRPDGDDAGGDSGDDVEKKKVMRAERNRQSAAASRERKKDLIRAQERRVSSLSQENAALQVQHINTRRTFMELTKRNRSMKGDVCWPL